ncbi:ABC1 kinase family protein [Chelatococcus reniformis]|uniref:ABC transporter n=1 Tax=Chelatococcus reniformis TaxID=1494448 RepID=A0A916TX28_9HYPH|nr:AarF/UbiB family protein [Chelatococcus reniformis]GGC48596.1 ABC transporter [Chelatococcus reniformis]
MIRAVATPDLAGMRERNRAARRIFTRIMLHVLWWDIVLAWGPLKRLRTPAGPRWARLARQYRAQAERLGGVLIKLGQYAGARVDLLPKEVTDVMADLHDAVPPAPAPAIVAQLEADFLLPLRDLFRTFEPAPIGAASLGQAHRAELPDGRRVVVKVLRPGIDLIVENDLVIIGRFIRLMKRIGSIRRRVDLDVLANEFITVTRRELDLLAEGRSSERFARQFSGDPEVYVPKIEWSRSGGRTLTMEDVSYVPIGDVLGYEATGVDRRRVAGKLMDVYLDQIFRLGFVHADPHPGNLFVQPLPIQGEPATRWSSTDYTTTDRINLPHTANRPFRLIFIDFGMAVEIPEHARRSLQTYAVGIAARDAYTIVQSYVEGDLLLPDTDVDQLERMTAAMLAKFPHAFVGQVRQADLPQYGQMFNEYQSLLYNSPMKIPAELLFVFRAMGICSGTVAAIDPGFDPAERFTPLAQRLVADELSLDSDRLKRFVMFGLRLPTRLDNLLTQIERGKLLLRTGDPDHHRENLRSRGRAASQIGVAVIAAGVMACAVQLGPHGEILTTPTGLTVLAVAVVALALLRGRR